MTVHLNKIMKMVADLKNINEQDERKTDEVRQYVKYLLRVLDPIQEVLRLASPEMLEMDPQQHMMR